MKRFNIPEKVSKTLYVALAKHGAINVYDFDPSGSKHFDDIAVICTKEVVFDLPQDFDPTQQMVANLERTRSVIAQEFSLKLQSIDYQIAELRALPPAAPDFDDSLPFRDEQA